MYRNLLNTGSRLARAVVVLFIAAAASACSTTTGASSRLVLAETMTPPEGAIAFCVARPDQCAPAQSELDAEADPGGSAKSLESGPLGGGRPDIPASRPAKPSEPAPVKAQDAPGAQAAGDLPGAAKADPAAASGSSAEGLVLDDETLGLIETVNTRVNRAMTWRSDRDLYALEEFWTTPLSSGLGREGDCEDFALEKRLALIEAGVPAERLALAQVYAPRTGMHAVLVVRAESGDLVLDNESPWVLPWRQTGYRWIAVQSGPSLLDWSRIAA
ncbi:MAG: transglutaminase-like cysteine peptidase [Oceanicaulis sp.]